MNADQRKSYRYTRQLARDYRRGMARQEIAPMEWREAGLIELSKKLHEALDWWHVRGLAHVYQRALK